MGTVDDIGYLHYLEVATMTALRIFPVRTSCLNEPVVRGPFSNLNYQNLKNVSIPLYQTSEAPATKENELETHLTASGQIFSPPLLVQMACSLTGVPVCAAFTIQPSLIKIPTCATLPTALQFGSPQNSMSPF